VRLVKGHMGTPGNERVDQLAGRAAEKTGPYGSEISLAHIKPRISEGFRKAKDECHGDPANHGMDEILPPPPKKSMLDSARNSLARVAAQIRTGNWRSAVYLKGYVRGRTTGAGFVRSTTGLRTRCPARMCFSIVGIPS